MTFTYQDALMMADDHQRMEEVRRRYEAAQWIPRAIIDELLTNNTGSGDETTLGALPNNRT